MKSFTIICYIKNNPLFYKVLKMKNNENFYSQWRKSTRGMDLDNQQFIELKDRPRCSIPGCTAPRQHLGTYSRDGNPNFRSVCQSHHTENLKLNNVFSTVTKPAAKKRNAAAKKRNSSSRYSPLPL